MIDPTVTFSDSLNARLNQAIQIAAVRSGFLPQQTLELDSLAGAAMLELIDLGLFPSYALDGPWVQKLENDGLLIDPPDLLCLMADDAILLAPSKIGENQWMGFLIAESTSSGRVRAFSRVEADQDSAQVMLQVPKGIVKRSSFAGCKSPAFLDIVS